MKLTTRKQRINFDIVADLTARQRIYSAFYGYKIRQMSKLIRHNVTLNNEDTLSNIDRTEIYDVEMGSGC